MASFDPRALLDPKKHVASQQKPANGSGFTAANRGAYADGYPQEHPYPAFNYSNGATSMIERMHNIQDRSEAPQKRRKVDSDEDIIEVDKSKFTGHGGSGGTLGRGLKEERQAAVLRAPHVLDLTNGRHATSSQRIARPVNVTLDDDDDDNCIVTKSNTSYDEEVCLGRIDGARVTAHQVPAPKMKGLVSSQNKYWPSMKIEVQRRVGTNTSIIGVVDSCGNDFGTIDVRTASVLARLMDSKASGIRVQARLDIRQRKPYEAPGIQTSDSYSASINIYAKRKMVNGIGTLFSQKAVFFRDPFNPDRGIPIVNPHVPKDYTPTVTAKAQRASRYTAGGTISRTQEEIKHDVSRIFDSLKTSAEPPEMEQPGGIKTPLLAHQKQALHFMTTREKDEYEDEASTTVAQAKEESSLWQKTIQGNGKEVWYNVITGQEMKDRPQASRGGILADVMGLGKTLNCLSLIMSTPEEAEEFGKQTPEEQLYDEDVTESELRFNTSATLVVCPVSTVSNWEEQIMRHLKKPKQVKVLIYHGSKRTNEAEDLTGFDIVITTYSTIAADFEKRARTRPNNPLAEINWFRIVLDEAHLIREQSTRQSKATCNLSAQRRWAVTGTPVQNRLDDLGALLKFLKIRPFDQPRNFQQYIITPFKQADTDVIEKLQVLVNSITLRRLKDKLDLPGREEKIVKLEFDEAERKFYDFFSKDSQEKVRAMTAGQSKIQGGTYAHVLRAILRLRLLCAHGADLLSDADFDISKGFSSLNAIDLEEEDEVSPEKTKRQAFDLYRMIKDANVHNCSKCNKPVEPRQVTEYDLEDEDEDDTFGFLTPCNQLICPDCIKAFEQEFKQNAASAGNEDGHGCCPICETYIRENTWSRLRSKEMEADDEAIRSVRANPRLAKHHGRYSGPHTKTKALLAALQADAAYSAAHCPGKPIKSVVFSGWTSHLDLIQIALTDAKINFTRLDGSMPRPARSEALRVFMTSTETCVILISLNAGGLGLNLTAASRVYVMEPQFNPAAEAQAVERVHRLGQTRDVRIVKYIMHRSFEEKMLQLQAKKRALADMSVSRERMKGSKEAIKSKLDELRELFR